MDIRPIPIFSDNYVWTLNEGADAVVVDPGDASPVLRELGMRGRRLRAILITHWHPYPIGGLPQLLADHKVPVYGPQMEAEKIHALTHLLVEGDEIEVATWPVRNDTRLRIERRFQVRRKATGETLLRALIHYVCIDLQTGKARRMPEEFTQYVVAPAVTAAITLENEAYQPGVEPR